MNENFRIVSSKFIYVTFENNGILLKMGCGEVRINEEEWRINQSAISAFYGVG